MCVGFGHNGLDESSGSAASADYSDYAFYAGFVGLAGSEGSTGSTGSPDCGVEEFVGVVVSDVSAACTVTAKKCYRDYQNDG